MALLKLPLLWAIPLCAPFCRTGWALWPFTADRPRPDPTEFPRPTDQEEGSSPKPERRLLTASAPKTPVKEETTVPAAMLKAWTSQFSPWVGRYPGGT